MAIKPRKKTNPIAAFFRGPGAAVVAAYVLRMSLMYLIHSGGAVAHAQFLALGQETSMIAVALAAGRGFSLQLAGLHGPTAWLAPVYPFLLSLGPRLLRLDADGMLLFGQTINCAFAALTCWPICAIGQKLFGRNIGLASAWLWVVLPTAVLFPLEWVWDQSLSGLLLAALVWATLSLADSASLRAWIAYGLLWAVAALTNPGLAIVLPFLLAWLFVGAEKQGKRALHLTAAAALAFLIGLLPWTIRNYAAFGQFVPVKSNFGLEVWLGNNPQVKVDWSWWRHPGSDPEQQAELARLGELAYMREKEHETFQFIAAEPAKFLSSCFDRFEDTWTGLWDARMDPWVYALGVRTAYEIFVTGFSLLALVGLMLARRAVDTKTFPLAVTLVVFPVTYYVTHSALHYRQPIDPVMTILAIYALACAYASVSAAWEGKRSLSTARSS